MSLIGLPVTKLKLSDRFAFCLLTPKKAAKSTSPGLIPKPY